MVFGDWLGSAVVGYFVSEGLRILVRQPGVKKSATALKESTVALVTSPTFPALAVLLITVTAANAAIAAIL